MLIFAKSLYPAPLLDIEIVANEELEKIHAILIIVKLIDLAQGKYKAIPNEQYFPGINRNISEKRIVVKSESRRFKRICIWFNQNVLIKLNY